jgi:hypothetical protein
MGRVYTVSFAGKQVQKNPGFRGYPYEVRRNDGN